MDNIHECINITNNFFIIVYVNLPRFNSERVRLAV